MDYEREREKKNTKINDRSWCRESMSAIVGSPGIKPITHGPLNKLSFFQYYFARFSFGEEHAINSLKVQFALLSFGIFGALPLNGDSYACPIQIKKNATGPSCALVHTGHVPNQGNYVVYFVLNEEYLPFSKLKFRLITEN